MRLTSENSGAGEILAAIEGMRSAPRPTDCTPEWMRQTLIDLRYAVDLIEVQFSAVAAAFSATAEREWQGSASAIDWIRHNCRMTGHAGSRAVCVGSEAPALPEAVVAVEEGRIGFAHLGLLASTARAVRQATGAETFDERPLLDLAREHSVSRFAYDCSHARHAADAAGFLADHLDVIDRRRLELIPFSDGRLAIRGLFDSVSGATIRTALEPLAAPSGAHDRRSREQRFADALVELAGHGLDERVIPGRAGLRPHLQLTASLDTLRGVPGAPAADLAFSTPIPAASAQRIACDSTAARILFDAASVMVDVGRARRIASPAMRRALHVRDGGCVWPGCERPPSWTAAHHVRHWAHEGPTNLPNLVLLCHRHHRMVHEDGWQIAFGADGRAGVVGSAPMPLNQRARAPDLEATA